MMLPAVFSVKFIKDKTKTRQRLDKDRILSVSGPLATMDVKLKNFLKKYFSSKNDQVNTWNLSDSRVRHANVNIEPSFLNPDNLNRGQSF